MEKRDNRQIIGIVGTVLVHLAVLLLLFAIYIRRPEDLGESGVSVMLGNVDVSQGMFDPATMTEVDLLPKEISPPENTPQEENVQDLLTQTEEETVAIKPKQESKPKEEKIKKEETPKPKEKTEAEKRAEAEKAAAEAAAQRIAGAFGKGSQMENKGTGTIGSGVEGSLEGNSSTGKTSGVGGNGTFDLGGRGLAEGEELPKPVKQQDEGRVVVTITVDPLGRVINTSINKRTNTVNASLRKAATEAARKARFKAVSGVNNQTGTITYYFKF